MHDKRVPRFKSRFSQEYSPLHVPFVVPGAVMQLSYQDRWSWLVANNQKWFESLLCGRYRMCTVAHRNSVSEQTSQWDRHHQKPSEHDFEDPILRSEM